MSDYDIARARLRATAPGELMLCADLDWKEVQRAATDINLENIGKPPAQDALSELRYILKAVADRPISSTDSSCAFCQAYGDSEPHGQMEFDSEHECVVITAKRLLDFVSSPDASPSATDATSQ